MGHIFQKVKLENPDNGKYVIENVLVDTDATDTVVPQNIASNLELEKFGKIKVETAKGFSTVYESICRITIKNRKKVVPVVISKTIKRILLGVTTLETMGFKVDPKRNKLISENLLLY